ncbi:MAG: DUF4957 domain-containing protein [Rikenellaceae bacterium]|nr:DUF4957 domain-containing protein [Rikenellaceae bacterium]
MQLYLDFYNRSTTDTVLIKQQMLAGTFSVEAGRTDTIKIYLNTEDYINQNYTISSSYDERTEEIVKPTIVPEGYTLISSEAGELSATITRLLADDEVEEIKLYLPAGAEYSTLGSPTITKSISLLAEEDEDKRVTVTSGNMMFNGLNIKYVHFEGIDFIPTADNLFANAANTTFDIEEFSLINCTVNNMGRGLIRFQQAGDFQIRNFTIDHCTFLSWTVKDGYAFIVGQAGNNFYHNFRLTNSTLYSLNSNKPLFEPLAGVETDMNFYIENCTFASNNASASYFDLRSNSCLERNISFTMKKCLFTAGDNLNPSYGLRTTATDNFTSDIQEIYATEGWATTNTSNFGEVIPVAPKSELFADYEQYDLTIIDKDSPVYTNGIGDPRWIK